MSFEDAIAADSSNIFTREFTYSSSRFRLATGQEVELCDLAVWIDELLLLYQLKQRNPDHDSLDPTTEQKWFEQKVVKVAVGQFADTLRYLREESSLPLMNRRGQTIDLSRAAPERVHLIALYDASDALPAMTISRKGRVSSRVGFVHFLSRGDYQALCSSLHTPFEIAEYLDFRADFVQRNAYAHEVSEKALFGKFLTDTDDVDEIADEHKLVVDRLVDDRNDFNISRLLWEYLDQIACGNEGTQYHAILRELAKLKRNMMREFRRRYEWAMEKCHDVTQPKPSRFFPVEQNCAFVAIPLPAKERDNWQAHLKAHTTMCKYDLQARRCLGFTTAVNADDPDTFCVHWLLLDFEWQQSDEMDSILSENDLFRNTKGQLIGKYILR